MCPMQNKMGNKCRGLGIPQTVRMILVVSSFGRAGSSLVMKMLQAGGYPILANKPGSLEHTGMAQLPTYSTWLEDGCAVKINDPHLFTPPKGLDYQFIWLSRDPKQQAKSMIKLNKALWPHKEVRSERASMRFKMKFIKKSTPQCLRLFKRLSKRPVIQINFEEIITNPEKISNRIQNYTERKLNINKMIKVVETRAIDIHPRIMEIGQ